MDYPKGIRPDGAGLRIRLWSGGKLVYSETIKGDPAAEKTISIARQRREWLAARLKLGLPLYVEEVTETQTFDAARDSYLASLDVKRSTRMSYNTLLQRYWSVFDHLPVNEITSAAIKQELARHNVSSKTKRNALIALRGVLNYAEIHPNPVDRVKIRRHQRPEIERYRPAERSALLDQLSGQELVYFAVLFGCGLRPGEALALEWTDYDGEELHVSKQIVRRKLERTTKTSVRRRVYVPTWARQHLNNHTTRFDGGYIFQTGEGKHHRDTDVFNGAWRRAHKRARIPYRIPYTCRHSRAAELLSTGVEPADAARQLGHSVEMFLRTYSEWIEEYTRDRDKSRFEGVTDENVGFGGQISVSD